MKDFYRGKRVFITGHTGFKGSWMCSVLNLMGAEVCGFALAPNTNPSLYELLKIDDEIQSVIGDIRDLPKLKSSLGSFSPEIVIHMAAQPLVRESYKNPVYTYETNVMGTVNILEAVRQCSSVKSFLNVTTDKVYKNNEWEWGYREIDTLDGFDPYSNSKSCSELVTSSYKNSFFAGDETPAISTARAGNVIGGGDFAADRIVPDCIRAASKGLSIKVRNPYSTRPYQHVLEPVIAYLLIAMKQFENKDKYAGCYNIGPNDVDCVATGKLADLFCKYWGAGVDWVNLSESNAPHEANFLKLDFSKITSIMGWKPRWNIDKAVEKTIEWSKCWLTGKDITNCTHDQIKQYLEVDL